MGRRETERHMCTLASIGADCQVKITDGAVIAAATMSHRYISDRFLPDKVFMTKKYFLYILTLLLLWRLRYQFS